MSYFLKFMLALAAIHVLFNTITIFIARKNSNIKNENHTITKYRTSILLSQFFVGFGVVLLIVSTGKTPLFGWSLDFFLTSLLIIMLGFLSIYLIGIRLRTH